MEKINFEDLPSTKTPINAINLNQLQKNVENEFIDLFKKEEFSSEEFDVTAGTPYRGNVPISIPEGYTLLSGYTYTRSVNANFICWNFDVYNNVVYFEITPYYSRKERVFISLSFIKTEYLQNVVSE